MPKTGDIVRGVNGLKIWVSCPYCHSRRWVDKHNFIRSKTGGACVRCRNLLNTNSDLLGRNIDLEGIFWSYVTKSEECWIWSGKVTTGGYGRLYFYNVFYQAHRLSWILNRGDIPTGLSVCHTCDNPPQVDNIHDAIRKGRFNPVERGRHCATVRWGTVFPDTT